MEVFGPGSPAWKARRAQTLTNELRYPLRWWFLSFADAERFYGGAILQAVGPMHAIEQAHRRGITPEGSSTACGDIEPGTVLPDSMKNRLLTRQEIEEHFGPMQKARGPLEILDNPQ